MILQVDLLDQANRRKKKLSLSGRVSTESQYSLVKVSDGSGGGLLLQLSQSDNRSANLKRAVILRSPEACISDGDTRYQSFWSRRVTAE